MFDTLTEQDIDVILVENGLMTMDDFIMKWHGYINY